jgi:hypothetical protein
MILEWVPVWQVLLLVAGGCIYPIHVLTCDIKLDTRKNPTIFAADDATAIRRASFAAP